MATILCLIMATTASAVAVTGLTVVTTPDRANETAQYEITFEITDALETGGQIKKTRIVIIRGEGFPAKGLPWAGHPTNSLNSLILGELITSFLKMTLA